jgi:predicted nucleic acid-binding protein
MMALVDNTVLSNFALVGKPELLHDGLSDTAVTTRQVMDEFLAGVAKGRLPETRWDWLPILELTVDEQTHFEQLLQRLNAGEASCLAIAAGRQSRVLTDHRDARKLAAQLRVPISGTLGVLLYLVERKRLSLGEANQLLREMVTKGYRSPVDGLDQFIK